MAAQLSDVKRLFAYNRPLPVIPARVEKCLERIRAMSPGDVVKYVEFTTLIGEDAQKRGNSTLRRARKLAQRDDRIVTGCVRNVGVKRLVDSEKVETAVKGIQNIAHTTDRMMSKLTAVDHFDQLSQDQKISYNAALSTFGAIRLGTSKETKKRVETAVARSQTAISYDATLALFVGEKAD